MELTKKIEEKLDTLTRKSKCFSTLEDFLYRGNKIVKEKIMELEKQLFTSELIALKQFDTIDLMQISLKDYNLA